MYKVNKEVDDFLNGNNRRFNARLSYERETITSGFVSIKQYQQSNANDFISIGDAVSSSVHVEMWKPDDFDIENKELNIEIEPVLNDEPYEYVGYGKVISFSNTDNAFFSGLNLYGKSEQDKTTGKNLLPYPFADTTITKKGVTFTDNGDGSIVINGTTTGAVGFTLFDGSVNTIPMNGDYILSIGLDKGLDGIYIQAYIDGNSQALLSSGERTYNWNGGLTQLSLFINADVTLSNYVVRPMIRIATITDST